jgi:hypothetical protein
MNGDIDGGAYGRGKHLSWHATGGVCIISYAIRSNVFLSPIASYYPFQSDNKFYPILCDLMYPQL